MNNRFCTPGQNRTVMKAGAKDPRNIVRNIRGYNPQFQADQRQFLEEFERRDLVPMAAAVEQSFAKAEQSTIKRAEYTRYPFAGVLSAAGVLLIPRNPNRLNFYVSNLNGSGNQIYLSFGPPVGGIATAMMGIPIQDALTFSEINNLVGIDDIWVAYNGFPAISTSLVGWEAVPALTNG